MQRVKREVAHGWRCLPALPTNLFAFFQGAHPHPDTTLRTLNPHQNDTVVAMIDRSFPQRILPAPKVRASMNSLTSSHRMADAKNAEFSRRSSPEWTNKLTTSSEEFVDARPSKSHCSFHGRSVATQRTAGCAMATHPKSATKQLRGEFFNVFKGITVHG